MYCTQCGREMLEGDRFCPSCGKPTEPGLPPPAPSRRLARDMNDKKIAGVCSGFARYLGLDVTLVRIVWILIVLAAGTGLLAYVIAWIVMPADYGTTPMQEENRQPTVI